MIAATARLRIEGELSAEEPLDAQKASDLIDLFLDWCKEEELDFDGSMFIPPGKYQPDDRHG